MDMKRLAMVTLAVAVVLMLSTIYLAIFYAPLPATSVKNAGSILSSAEGSKITISGFIIDLITTGNPVLDGTLDSPQVISFNLADFSDYQRYFDAASANATSSNWWTVTPIHVGAIVNASSLDPPSVKIIGTISNGANVSVSGTIIVSNPAGSEPTAGLRADMIEVNPTTGFSVATAPVAQKIFYFHMPSAWSAYLSFGVALLSSIIYLRTKNQKYDRWAHSSVEIGVVFATIAILTGPVWAKQEWGVYWRWDDTKLVTTFILWLVYIGYLSLRAAISEPSARSRISAVYGILGFITVPMSFLSARIAPLLSSSHPEVIASSSGSLSPEAGMTIGIAVVAFTFLFITMLIKRVEIGESEEEIEELKRKIGGEE